jgi:hypothetical protein
VYGSTANTAVQGNTTLAFAGTTGEITVDGGSSITLGAGGTVTYGLADTITGNRTFSGNVTIEGNATLGNALTDNHFITGALNLSGSVTSSAKILISGSSNNQLRVFGSGSSAPIFSVYGSLGELFSIVDTFTGDLFTVSDISGAPILAVSSSGTVYVEGALGVGTDTPTTIGLIRATNDVVAYYSSDERLKTNIQKISEPLEKLQQINGVEFDWIPKKGIHENEGRDIGVIAQQIEKVLPSVVTTRDNGYKAIKYERLVALLIETNKELLKRIEALESKIK